MLRRDAELDNQQGMESVMLPQKMITAVPFTKSSPAGTLLGYRADGRPIRLIGGGSESGTESGGDSGGDSGQGDGQDSQGGGQGSEQRTYTQADFDRLNAALEKERTGNKAGQAATRELTQLKRGAQTDQEKAVTAAREEATREVTSKYQTRIGGLSVRAAAAGKFQNPKVAQALLADRMGEFVSDDGDVDDSAIEKALTELLKNDPYLGSKQEEKAPDFDGGQRGGAAGSTNMNDLIRRSLGGGR